jgi:isoamylase
VRRYWKGDEGQLAELGYRLTGSSDLYISDRRSPTASINFVTAHDGFTLHDLVSYNEKHNEANNEENRDGANDNYSFNCGVECETDDAKILAVRNRQVRNFLVTLLLSQGVPMICGGDEIGRTQRGNNNAYCQDNEISWYDWKLGERKRTLLDFTRLLIAIRRQHATLQRRKFFQDRGIYGSGVHGLDLAGRHEKDICWLRPDGTEMTDAEWNNTWAHTLGLQLSGRMLDEVDQLGTPIADESFLILLNAHSNRISFCLPPLEGKEKWELLVDTKCAVGACGRKSFEGGARYLLQSRSAALFRIAEPPAGGA